MPLSLHRRKNLSGVALVMVLWILVLLTMIVTEFTFATRMEFEVALNYNERTQSYYYAQAGINAAIAEMMKAEGRLMYYNGQDEDLVFHKKRKDNNELERPPRRSINFGNGGFRYSIKDESGKLDLNALTEPNNARHARYLNDMLERAGVDEETLAVIRQSAYDWRDADDAEKPEGAEDDWYETNYDLQGYDKPYLAKNSAFDSVAEFAMVRGVSQALLYGGAIPKEIRDRQTGTFKFGSDTDEQVSYKAIAPYLTVYNYDNNRMNINFWTADPYVLRIMAGDNDDLYAAYMEARNRGPFEGHSHGFAQTSQTFRVVSTGFVNDGSPNQTIVAVLRMNINNKRSDIKILAWLDDAPLPAEFGGPTIKKENVDDDTGFFGNILD